MTPIERMIMSADLRCTVCGAKAGTCRCWLKCHCGWSFLAGETCRNPAHGLADAVAREVLSHIDLMYPGMWEAVAARSARKSIRNVIRQEVEAALKHQEIRAAAGLPRPSQPKEPG